MTTFSTLCGDKLENKGRFFDDAYKDKRQRLYAGGTSDGPGSMNMARIYAKKTKQKAQLASIDTALTVFRNDYGDYPPSEGATYEPFKPLNYCGAQKLCEALLGRDLMGFHPGTGWFPGDGVYDPTEQSLQQRTGRYLELATANAFKLGDLFKDTGVLEADTFVLCDVFGYKTIPLPPDGKKSAKAGAPILYYRANTAGMNIEQIYNFDDNNFMIQVKAVDDGNPESHPLYAGPGGQGRDFFYYGTPPITNIGYIQDPRITAKPWPYRPDSYLLITAGPDGLYGTADDIRNFGN